MNTFYLFICVGFWFMDCDAEKEEDILKIVGGTSISIEEVPFMALFRPIGKNYHCGACIVSDRFVVSAAHCYRPQPMDITVGTDKALDEGRRYHIEKVVIHPLYNTQNHDNDVCVIKIKGTFEFSDRVAPIPMASPNTVPKNGAMLLTIGFGETMTNLDYIRAPSNQLLGVKVPHVDREVCRQKLRRYFEITDNMICAGGQTGKDSCKGDSGGPLVYQEGDDVRLVGIVSFGYHCATDLPAVYTDVAAMRTFIDRVMQQNSCFLIDRVNEKSMYL